MNHRIEMLAAENAKVGEGPLWIASERSLYWTDIQTGRCFRYDPSTGTNETIHRGVFVGGLTVNRNGGMIFGTWDGVMLWRSDNDWRWYRKDESDRGDMRFNDVTAGPDGSFYAGPANGDRMGNLHRFKPDGTHEIVADSVSISNGMGWSPDLSTFYYTDSIPKQIYAFDYDSSAHKFANKRVFVQLGDELGVPDGMTVDSEGFVWSANWGGGCVIRFDPDGKEERRVMMPATQSSSVMFGGSDLTDIYVTSANSGTGEEPGALMPKGYDNRQHRGGELYVIRQDEVQGKPEFDADLKWPD